MNIIVIAAVIITIGCIIVRPINKEKYMDQLKGMNTNKYMGVGMLALTENKVDVAYAILFPICVVLYLMYRAYMDYREHNSKRYLMRKAMHDYSYSSKLVRILDEEK